MGRVEKCLFSQPRVNRKSLKAIFSQSLGLGKPEPRRDSLSNMPSVDLEGESLILFQNQDPSTLLQVSSGSEEEGQRKQ